MRKACVIGWPIKHSRSPLIHGYWLEKYGINGSYEKLAISPQQINSFLKDLNQAGFIGCNVTIPHKETAFQLVQITDEVTRRIGAVNTVFLEQGQPYGLNTDGFGFLSNLKSQHKPWTSREKTCVLIGAGGAARAIIAILLDDGTKSIHLVNRTKSRAQQLALEFGPQVQASGFDDLPYLMQFADLLVNTTSLGMLGQPPLEISLASLPSDCVVADIVYDPLETDLMRNARQLGLSTVDGLGMLLHQAVPGFEKWFGIRPEVTSELRVLLIDDLTKGDNQ